MFLSKKKIIIIISSVFIICILFYSAFNFNRINYLADKIRSVFYDVTGHQSGAFKIVDVIDKKYIKPYDDIPDTFIHSGNMLFIRAKKGAAVSEIAKKAIRYTYFYRSYKLKNAIMEYNGLSGEIISTDMNVFIPYSVPELLPDIRNEKKPEPVYTKGLYFTGNSAGSSDFLEVLSKFRKAGINTVVIDAKDVTGDLTYLSETPGVVNLNTHEKRSIENIDRLIRILKDGGIYTIARIAVFRDHLLYKKKPEYAIASASTGKPLSFGANELWCDPTNRHVQDYNLQIAIELAEIGVDEIQFDYIRFPTKGNLSDAKYAYDFGRMPKEDVIAHFLKRAYGEITARNTLLSIDIFGVVAWAKESDIAKLGQRIEKMSKFCDVLSPMLYPSHFNDNFNGFANPGDEPYHFIYTGCVKTRELSGGKKIRPWLQAFGWRASKYNEDYIIKQINACNDSNAFGYLFWNSTNKYDYVYKALMEMNAGRE